MLHIAETVQPVSRVENVSFRRWHTVWASQPSDLKIQKNSIHWISVHRQSCSDDKVWPMVAPGAPISEVFDEKDLQEKQQTN